jgi:hypothetical protein
MAHIISSDDIKETLPNYDPNKAEDFHEESQRIADKKFEEALKSRPEKTVIIMSGGSASGKSEYVSVYLKSRKVIIYDGTSSTYERVKGKLDKAISSGKLVEIHAVWPQNFRRAFIAFGGRERQFSEEHFYRTHSNSRKVLLTIAQKYQDIRIYLTISDYVAGQNNMKFNVVTEENRSRFIEYLNENQYTKERIIERVLEG